ncbi:phosphohistidine phosphatase [Nautilia profundicola AmH]|uniref:Phosphohistidine phosphatase n=1 Tax=Nautilia profundicola (strain ATCC BAA-1463 / DSM 18972 / AmH) TaxID=598659 RepID=B9LA20_NAUPA|nr:histidine phosphatase family protein [Nautilia profundicola]ACM93355.1 phosphohistidine phosphatase [Nautilia profundicola AmH]
MKILFIRHSLAMERDEWTGHDFERPLTDKGMKRAKKFFKHIKKIYPEIDYIITSKALRAKQTAEILRGFYNSEVYEETPLLYPGATFNDLKQAIKNKEGIIAIVGHEPDLSNFVKELMYAPNLKLKLRKPSLIEMEEGIMKALIQYRHFKDEHA